MPAMIAARMIGIMVVDQPDHGRFVDFRSSIGAGSGVLEAFCADPTAYSKSWVSTTQPMLTTLISTLGFAITAVPLRCNERDLASDYCMTCNCIVIALYAYRNFSFDSIVKMYVQDYLGPGMLTRTHLKHVVLRGVIVYGCTDTTGFEIRGVWVIDFRDLSIDSNRTQHIYTCVCCKAAGGQQLRARDLGDPAAVQCFCFGCGKAFCSFI
jgi:hypothetical protein